MKDEREKKKHGWLVRGWYSSVGVRSGFEIKILGNVIQLPELTTGVLISRIFSWLICLNNVKNIQGEEDN